MWPMRVSNAPGGGGGGGAGSSGAILYPNELDFIRDEPLQWADDEGTRALSPKATAMADGSTTVHHRLAVSEHVSSIAFPGRARAAALNVNTTTTKSGRLRSYRSDASATASQLATSTATTTTTRAPIRLDKRRLDKAVSLAIEAAQASEQDERAWRRYDRQQRRTQSNAAALPASSRPPLASEGRMSRLGRLRSLGGSGWKRASLDLGALQRRYTASTSSDAGEGEAGDAQLVPYTTPRDSGGSTSGTTTLDDGAVSSSSADNSDDDEQSPPTSDDYSVDLYISSLGYLLAALKPEDATTVRDGQRRELIGKLREALANLEETQTNVGQSDEDVMIVRLQHKLAMLEQVSSHGGQLGQQQFAQGRLQALRPPCPSPAPKRRSISGYLAASAFDFGLSVGAGVVAVAARGVAGVLPTISGSTSPVVDGSQPAAVPPRPPPQQQQQQQGVARRPALSTRHTSPATAMEQNALLSGPQWDLTRSLVGTVGSTLYNQLAAVAEQQRKPAAAAAQVTTSTAMAVRRDGAAEVETEDAADQLVLLSASLARSVKRSPLPTQVRSLARQVVSLAAALDKRYALSKRTVDVALRQAGNGLTFVRRNDLHVKAVRVAWAMVEAGVVAMEAYRDEEGWSADGGGGEEVPRLTLEDKDVDHVL